MARFHWFRGKRNRTPLPPNETHALIRGSNGQNSTKQTEIPLLLAPKHLSVVTLWVEQDEKLRFLRGGRKEWSNCCGLWTGAGIVGHKT